MRFADLIAPVSPERFMADYYGRRPLHIPAPAENSRAGLLSWSRMNGLLGILPHWTDANLKLIMNSRPVAAEFYMIGPTQHGTARRADPAKVDVFLAMGASLVANAVEEISSEIRDVTDALGEQFSARAGANAYCSFQAVRAFGSHCDLHEVFALHCEGEKVWNIYQNRAEAPIASLQGDDAQDMIDAAKGEVMLQVRMRPGDLLYIPRGYYHDALASSEASLHLTFSVAPLTGRYIFRMLEESAVTHLLFRSYLPDRRAEDGAALRRRLEELAEKIVEIVTSSQFASEVSDAQRRLREPNYKFRLPQRQTLEFFARANQPAEIKTSEREPLIVIGGRAIPLRSLREPAEWLMTRPAFSLQELFARYPYIDNAELRALVSRLQAAGLFLPYSPEL